MSLTDAADTETKRLTVERQLLAIVGGLVGEVGGAPIASAADRGHRKAHRSSTSAGSEQPSWRRTTRVTSTPSCSWPAFPPTFVDGGTTALRRRCARAIAARRPATARVPGRDFSPPTRAPAIPTSGCEGVLRPHVRLALPYLLRLQDIHVVRTASYGVRRETDQELDSRTRYWRRTTCMSTCATHPSQLLRGGPTCPSHHPTTRPGMKTSLSSGPMTGRVDTHWAHCGNPRSSAARHTTTRSRAPADTLRPSGSAPGRRTTTEGSRE